MSAISALGLCLGLILLPAAIGKTLSPSSFVEAIGRFHFLPAAVRPAVSRGFPLVEGTLGILLVISGGQSGVILAGSSMFLVFAAAGRYMRSQLSNSPGPACGCLGGVGELKITSGSVFLNLAVGAVGLSAVPTSWLTDGSSIVGVVGYGLAILMASSYWLAIYAFSVLDTVNEATRKGTVS